MCISANNFEKRRYFICGVLQYKYISNDITKN